MTAVTLAGLICLAGSCRPEVGRGKPVLMDVSALQYAPGVITVTLGVWEDSTHADLPTNGSALITVEQYTATDSGYRAATIYKTTREVRRDEFKVHQTLFGKPLLYDVGDISYADIERWRKQQGGRAEALDTTKVGAVRIIFATDRGVTLNAAANVSFGARRANGASAKRLDSHSQ